MSQLVIKKTIYTRIDRPAGIVTFRENKDPNEVLNEWSHNLNSLMALVSKTTHLINNEDGAFYKAYIYLVFCVLLMDSFILYSTCV